MQLELWRGRRFGCGELSIRFDCPTTTCRTWLFSSVVPATLSSKRSSPTLDSLTVFWLPPSIRSVSTRPLRIVVATPLRITTVPMTVSCWSVMLATPSMNMVPCRVALFTPRIVTPASAAVMRKLWVIDSETTITSPEPRVCASRMSCTRWPVGCERYGLCPS